MDAKRLRDDVGHSVRVKVVEDYLLEVTGSVLYDGEVPTKGSTQVSREELVDAIHKCRWLEAQIIYVMQTGARMSRGSQPIVAVKPSRLPKDWDGVVYRPA